MSSSSNPDPWSPYETYKDCSLGICSRYCPQWCYVIFPPPPPDDDSSGDVPEFSPLVIAVIGILASAFLLVTYYALVSRYCRRRTQPESAPVGDEPEPAGLEEALIKTIRVCRYKKSDGFVEGTDCSVCLTEFVEDESLRLLPKCNHAFHLPCIDTWLKNQATCPLCRSALNPLPLPPAPPRTLRLSAMQHRPASDAVLFLRDLERVLVVETQTERSASLDSENHHQRQVVLISDILQEIEIEEDGDGDGEVESENPEKGSLSRLEIGEGNSKSGVKVKRSRSTERCKLARHGKNGSSTVIHT